MQIHGVLSGWVGPADEARNQSDLQYLFLNGRVIRDPVLTRAVRRAYGEALPSGSYPAYVLALELPGSAFDVNVHPAKSEVRFTQPRSVHDFVLVAIRRAIDGESEQANSTADGSQSKPIDTEPYQQHPVATRVAGRFAVRPSSGRVRGDWSVYGQVAASNTGSREEVLSWVQFVGERLAVLQGGGQLWILDVPVLLRQVLTQCSADAKLARRPFLVPEPLEGDDDCVRAWRSLLLEIDQRGPDRWILRSAPACLGEINAGCLAHALSQAGSSEADALQALACALSEDAILALHHAHCEDAGSASWLRVLDEQALRRSFV